MAAYFDAHFGILQTKAILPLTSFYGELNSHQAVTLVSAAIILTIVYLFWSAPSGDGLPVANKLFPFEPRFFARVRWTFRARDILETADKNVKNRIICGGQISRY